MVRNFVEEPLDEPTISRLLDNAMRAPSAGFSQGFEFLVLTDAEDRRRFWDASWAHEHRTSRVEVMHAPLIIVPCAHKQAYLDRYAEPDKGYTDRDESRWSVPYWQIDTAFASMLILLTAVDLRLGAVFFSLGDEQAVRQAFGIPDAFAPIGAIAVGRAAPDVPSPSLARGRRPTSSATHRGAW